MTGEVANVGSDGRVSIWLLFGCGCGIVRTILFLNGILTCLSTTVTSYKPHFIITLHSRNLIEIAGFLDKDDRKQINGGI